MVLPIRAPAVWPAVFSTARIGAVDSGLDTACVTPGLAKGEPVGIGEHLASATPATQLTRRSLLQASAMVGGSAVGFGLASRSRASTSNNTLPSAITSVMQKPRYSQSTWSLLVADVPTGETLYELHSDQMALTGSVRKLFSVGLALEQLGVDHRFTTRVYRRGAVDAQGALMGDLVLVAAGDLTLGGRLNADGTIAFTDFDHNDANNLSTAILTPQDPLRGLDDLAHQVRASGIRTIAGDVVVDDRLFDSFRVPNQRLLITPIMVNENMVDVTVAPTQVGQAASVDWRPQTGAFNVHGTVTTAAEGTPDTVSLSGNGLVDCLGTAGCSGTVEGDIPVGYQASLSDSNTLVRVFRMEDPSTFARTAFIEALMRAGVTVKAAAVATNAAGKLPETGSYS